MTWKAPRPAGLKPTLRQVMIVILWSALLFAITRSLIQWKVIGLRIDFDCLMIPILGGSIPLPMLALLLFLLDRPGPVRKWYRSYCMAGSNFVAGTLFLLQHPACYLLTGHRLAIVPFGLFLSIPMFWAGVKEMRSAWPRRCLQCERRTVIACSRLRRQRISGKICMAQNGWCASCGASYERPTSEAEWQPKIGVMLPSKSEMHGV